MPLISKNSDKKCNWLSKRLELWIEIALCQVFRIYRLKNTIDCQKLPKEIQRIPRKTLKNSRFNSNYNSLSTSLQQVRLPELAFSLTPPNLTQCKLISVFIGFFPLPPDPFVLLSNLHKKRMKMGRTHRESSLTLSWNEQ